MMSQVPTNLTVQYHTVTMGTSLDYVILHKLYLQLNNNYITYKCVRVSVCVSVWMEGGKQLPCVAVRVSNCD